MVLLRPVSTYGAKTWAGQVWPRGPAGRQAGVGAEAGQEQAGPVRPVASNAAAVQVSKREGRGMRDPFVDRVTRPGRLRSVAPSRRCVLF